MNTANSASITRKHYTYTYFGTSRGFPVSSLVQIPLIRWSGKYVALLELIIQSLSLNFGTKAYEYRSRIHENTISLRFPLQNLESSHTCDFYTMFTSQTCFKTLLLKRGRGEGVKFLVEVIVNSKEENSEDFCPGDCE